MVRPLPRHRSREYETTFILHPETTRETIDKMAARLVEVIERLEGKLLRAENWGRRRLAYPVKKQAKGIYIYLQYLGYQDMVAELERNLRMLDPVMKYLTVKIDEDVDPDARPVRQEDISFLPDYEEESDEREREDARADGDDETDREEAAPSEEQKEEASEEKKDEASEVKEEASEEKKDGASEEGDAEAPGEATSGDAGTEEKE